MRCSGLSAADRAAVLKALFDPAGGCKFNICRRRADPGASDYALDYYSLDDTAGGGVNDYALNNFSIARDQGCLIPYIKAAMAYRPDLQVWGSAWTPPAWMKVSGSSTPATVSPTPSAGRRPSCSPTRCISRSMSKPTSKPAFRSTRCTCRTSPTPTRSSPRACGRRISCAISPATISAHVSPPITSTRKIWLGTINNGDATNTTLHVLADTGARGFISGCGFQWAGKDAIGPTHATAYPNLKMMQTESECGDGSDDWNAAMHTYGLLLSYLGNFANSYMYWNMVLDSGGVSNWGWKQNALISIDTASHSATYNSEFHIMKHFSAFVAPGAQRVAVSGADMAFRNPDGSRVLVTANQGGGTLALAVRVDGRILQLALPANSGQHHRHRAGAAGADRPDRQRGDRVEHPPRLERPRRQRDRLPHRAPQRWRRSTPRSRRWRRTSSPAPTTA